MIKVTVSGGFDPLHIGHIRLLMEAKEMGDHLIVILNNDNWLIKKKGLVFMPQAERKEIIESIRYVDEVLISNHPHNPTDMSVCQELLHCRPNFFVNGGDRNLDNIPEVEVCNTINCKMIFNKGVGGKVQSSSWLLEKVGSHQVTKI